MFIIDSYFIAVLFCILTMFCWGSWGNTQKLASKSWAFQHFYWDYALGVLLFSLLVAFTIGSFGSLGRSFLTDLSQGSSNSFTSAFLGGVIFNFANILLVIAINIAGLAVAFPVGIGLALVIGVVVNYIATPSGNPFLLFIGVFLIVVAIVIDAIAYKNITDTKDKRDLYKGILFSVLAGIAMGFFYRFVIASMSMNFSTPEVGKYTPYTALVIFALGLFVSNFVWNSIVMYKPVTGQKATYSGYFKQGNTKLHLIGLLGGAIWSLGMIASIISAEKAGSAVSYGLGQGATMISAAWGIFIWKEFSKSPNKKQTTILLTLMFISFIAGLVFIILSRV